MERIHFTLKSDNSKTGKIPVSGQQSNTCPATCAFRQSGCYAKYGPVRVHWDRLNRGESGLTWKQFLGQIVALPLGQIWRWGMFGDFKHKTGQINAGRLSELTEANRGKSGFGYTHHEVLSGPHAESNRAAIKTANQNGFTVNLSGNNVEHADKLKALGIAPVVSVVPQDSPNSFATPGGNKIIVCPAQTRDDMTCAICQLCSKASRSIIIGFKPHGSGAKYVREVAIA